MWETPVFWDFTHTAIRIRYKYRVGSSDPVVRVRVSHHLARSAIPQPSRSKRLWCLILPEFFPLCHASVCGLLIACFLIFSGSILVLFDLRRPREACAFVPKGSLVDPTRYIPVFSLLLPLSQWPQPPDIRYAYVGVLCLACSVLCKTGCTWYYFLVWLVLLCFRT